jgi:hypothetical protein
MKSISLFFLFFFISALAVFSQDTTYQYHDGEQWCKFEPATNHVTELNSKMPFGPLPLPLNSEITCGAIKITFWDVVNATGDGFDDATLGATRRNCVCDAMNYLQTVITFPSTVTAANPLEILFDDSQNTLASPVLGFATMSFPAAFTAGTPGYYGGFVYDYITTGINPTSSGMEHGTITMNFAHPYSYCDATLGDCEYDFQSIILHEMGHLLGVGSMMNENTVTDLLESAAAPNVFTVFDERFLFYNNGTGFDKMVDRILYSGNGGINPALPANMFTTWTTWNEVYTQNTAFVNKTNQPVTSRPGGFMPGTTLSHLDQDYITRTSVSPAFSPNYIMNGFLNTATFKNVFTKEELRIFQVLGYTINTVAVTNYTNSPPNLTGNVVNPSFVTYPSAPVPAGNNNLLISTSNCNNVVINLASNSITNGSATHPLGIYDINSNSISVFNGQLFNLRGCSSGGNNNNQLAINPGNNIITFTPRANFTGRAQFAFHLFDGMDRGAYIVITIDVNADACFNNGIEHVINGTLEEGKLIRTTIAPNNLICENLDQSGSYMANRFSDGQEYITWGWQDQVVENSFQACLFGADFQSFPTPGTAPLPFGGAGDRYTGYASAEPFHHRLDPALLSCHNYLFSMNVRFDNSIAIGAIVPMIVTLRNTIGGANLVTIPATVTNNGNWQTVTFAINYTNPLPANFIFFNLNHAGYGYVDNISIVNNVANPGTFPTVTVTPGTPAAVCSGQSVNLTAGGAATYSWAPATGLSATTGASVTATPASTTTYTVTGTNGGGCQSTAVVTVTINQSSVVVPSSFAVCPGSTVPATSFSSLPSGATYTWTNSNTAIGLAASGSTTVPSFTAVNSGTSPVTATITVTPTLGGCTGTPGTYIITVNPIPTVTVPANFTVCPGSSVVATNFVSTPAGATYAWTNSNTAIGLPASGVANVPAFTSTNPGTAAIAATITVTPSYFGCAGTPASYTITVSPRPLVTIPGNIAPCAGSTVAASNFTSTPAGATYSWTNSNTAIGLAASGTGNTPSFTATNAGTSIISGTITVTATLSGCTNIYTYTITVTPSNCVGTTVISAVAGNNTFISGSTTLGTSGMTYSVVDNITVQGASTVLTITSPDMRFYSGKKIILRSGATLIVSAAWLHSCSTCSGMWGGIDMERGTHLQVINGSVIEDATSAVATNVAGTGIPDYTIDQAIFNKNQVNISVAANVSDMSANTIKNTLFTCRSITVPTPGTFTANFNALKTALVTNTPMALSFYPGSLTIAGARSSKGVELNQLTFSSTYPKIGNSTGGSADMNVFDNLNYGVYLNSARCNIKNSTFQNMSGAQPVGMHGSPTPASYGVGVFAPIQTSQLNISLVIGGAGTSEACFFYNCYRGIEINNYYMVNSTSNTFVCSSTPAIFGTYSIGGQAVFLKDIQETVMIKGSSTSPITNWSTGIWFTRNTASTGTLNPSFDIDGNVISANASGYCNQAILISDIATTITNPTTVYVRNNTIGDVKNGIKASNIKNNLIIYNNPSITLRYSSSGILSGIFLEGCDKAEVKNNAVSCPRPGTTYGTAENASVRGIFVKTSTNNKIFCNTLTSLGQCLVFEAGCTSSGSGYGVFGNDMSNARIGYQIRSSGVIGTQGDATTTASGNHWINSGLNFSDGQTNVVSSVPGSSILYCASAGSSTPTSHTGTPAYFNGTTILLSSGSEISCPTLSVPAGMATYGSGLRTMDPETSRYVNDLTQMLNSSSSNSGTFNSFDWMTNNFIYREIKENSILQSDSVLNAFYTSNQNSAYGILNLINDEIEIFNYSSASALNNSFVPENIIESYQQRFNDIYLSHTDSVYAYSESEISSLWEIAEACAVIGGNAVYQSRNLLMSIENNVIEFEDNCNVENMAEGRAMTTVTNTKEMKVYPNPTTGKITLACGLVDNESGWMQIYDLKGNLVKSFHLSNGTKTAHLDAGSLQPGLYQYRIIVNGKTRQEDKLIIIK